MRCLKCGADLHVNNSLTYTEHYQARLSDDGASRATVEPHSDSIESSACCAKCGAAVEYEDVDFMS
ncbi:MAG: hypothetical protein EG823_05740 [Actinobacteria bacterium]|nr:hypothetical protein [Actinomycetota bacterium]